MPKSWNDYAKKATTAETGGDFPDIDDGLYNAIIQDVSDMIEDEGNGRFGPSTKFYVTWEFENQDGETVSRRQYIKVADGFLDHHNIHPKSALHKFMSGLGFDMTPPEVEVDPPSWQGMEAKILIENKAPEGGGEVRRNRLLVPVPYS